MSLLNNSETRRLHKLQPVDSLPPQRTHLPPAFVAYLSDQSTAMRTIQNVLWAAAACADPQQLTPFRPAPRNHAEHVYFTYKIKSHLPEEQLEFLQRHRTATPCAPSEAKEPFCLPVHAKGDVPTNTAPGGAGQ